MDKQGLKVFISAGETSGDLHAAAVIQALKARIHDADIEISGIAGAMMKAQGCNPVCDISELNVMGIGDVIKALPRIRRVGKRVVAWAEREKPDVAILVDFPGFNMRLGEKLKALGIPVLYYIAPKLWAWGHWRVKRLKRAQDKLACILPFEPEWFSNQGIDSTYVGNPSAVSCQSGWSKSELREQLGVSENIKILALLPGSRKSELKNHAALLANAYEKILQKHPDIQAVTTRAPGISDEQLKPLLDVGVKILNRLDEHYALRADAAIAVSGTATLELALWDVPTVLVYKSSALMIWIARKLVGTRCAGLANIILDDKPVMPELIQEQASLQAIVKYISPLLEGGREAELQHQAFIELQQRLGCHHPSHKVAAMILSLAKKN